MKKGWQVVPGKTPKEPTYYFNATTGQPVSIMMVWCDNDGGGGGGDDDDDDGDGDVVMVVVVGG